ncbi:MAG: hypothetical protein GX633_03815, partial [Clostridiales bacterium]|nr:hypothetical protein [Clostridiales bacterium]
MKKVLALILALILILSLAACSDTVKTDNNTNAPSKKSDEPVTIVLQAGPWVEYADNIERL